MTREPITGAVSGLGGQGGAWAIASGVWAGKGAARFTRGGRIGAGAHRSSRRRGDWRLRLTSGGLENVWVRSQTRQAFADVVPAPELTASDPHSMRQLTGYRCRTASFCLPTGNSRALPSKDDAGPGYDTPVWQWVRPTGRMLRIPAYATAGFGNTGDHRLATHRRDPRIPPHVLHGHTRPALALRISAAPRFGISDASDSTRNVPVSALDERVKYLIPITRR